MFSSNSPNSSGISYNPTTSKYLVTFAGKRIETTVTDKGAVADEWVREILSLHVNGPVVVGLYIKWRLREFIWMRNTPATLQLCIDERCLVLQLCYVDQLPESLKDFLTNSNFIFVGPEVAIDIKKLYEIGLVCANSVDIRWLAKQRWPGRIRRRPRLKELAWELVNFEIEGSEGSV